MSIAENKTSELWREFRSRAKAIAGRIGDESYSARVYSADYSFSRFDPHAVFDKWACVRVGESNPEFFEILEIPSGKYAVFHHSGLAASAPTTFGYIFGTWVLNSGFDLDDRPHFEILPARYDPFDPVAEEEIWVPVRTKLT